MGGDILTPWRMPVEELERGRESYASGSGSTPSSRCRRADQAQPLSAEDLELLARSAYMLGRDDEYVSALERAHRAALDAGDGAAGRPLCVLDRPQLPVPRGVGARAGAGLRAGSGCSSASSDCVERGYLLIPGLWSTCSAATTRPGTRPRSRSPDRRALRRPRPRWRSPRWSRATRWSGRAGRRTASGWWTRRWWRSRRGSCRPIVTGIVYCNTIAFCRDRVRAAARPGVDRRADAVVRPAARDGGAQRAVPGAPRGAHAARGRLGGRPGGGAPARRALYRGRPESAGARAGRLPAGGGASPAG